jgi:hypothetical protein
MSNESYITVQDGRCTGFAGPDAVDYVRATVLASALKLYAKAKICPTRGVGIKAMLLHATAYTGKKYRIKDAQQAADDVLLWAREMKAALPVVQS